MRTDTDAKGNLFCKDVNEILKRRWEDCVPLERNYAYELSRILSKSCCFNYPTDFLAEESI